MPTFERIDGVVRGISTWMALLAGLVLVGLAILTVVSVFGRSLVWAGLGPIPGDFELAEIGTAIAVFGFLPYCHLERGHVTVDVLVDTLPNGARNALTLLGDLALAVIFLAIAWRLWPGFLEKIAYGENTMILGAPLWLGYGPAFLGAAWAGLVSVHVLLRDIRTAAAGGRLS